MRREVRISKQAEALDVLLTHLEQPFAPDPPNATPEDLRVAAFESVLKRVSLVEDAGVLSAKDEFRLEGHRQRLEHELAEARRDARFAKGDY